MAWEPISKQWPGDSAILLVYGVGDPKATYYDPIIQELKTVPGVDWDSFAIYPFSYEMISDWFNEKNQLGNLLETLKSKLGLEIGDGDFGNKLAETIGDVIWPVLSSSAREAARAAYIAQLNQLVIDGCDKNERAKYLNISIICHSFGCFHTYEALHAAASTPSYNLQPYSAHVRFKNVIFMASPVQMIRTVATKLGPLVPDQERLATLRGNRLTQPGETTWYRKRVRSVENWVSITGNLDAVGGHFARKKKDWAYMDVEDQVSRVDQQSLLVTETPEELLKAIAKGLAEGDPPELLAESPHSWTGYIERHRQDLEGWLTA